MRARRSDRILDVAIGVGVVVALGVGCDLHLRDLPPDTGLGAGSVTVSFIRTARLTIHRLTYAITGNGIQPLGGAMDLTNDAAAPSALIGGIPPGRDYRLELDATADVGSGLCHGVALFDVVAAQASPVEVTLICSTPETVRTFDADGVTDYCPSLASFAASPPFAPLGGTILLSATAFSYYSDPLRFAWDAASGSFSSLDTAVTTYTCEAVGPQLLRVTVTDGWCPDTATVRVTCGPPPVSRVTDGGTP
jgi:hypothetical protein